jgi:membrane protein
LTTANWERVTPILETFPQSTRLLVQEELQRVANWNGGAVGLTGAAVSIWLASTAVHSMFEAFEVESHVRRSWIERRLLAIATCAGLSVVVAALTTLWHGLRRIIALAAPNGGNFDSSVSMNLARAILSFVIAIGYVSALYWIGIPRPGRSRWTLVPGALVAVVLQGTMSFGYALYLSRFTEHTVYGAGLGIVGATLMALYLFALSLLSGAAVIRRLDKGRQDDAGVTSD